MTRQSTTTIHHDTAGDYETEIFSSKHPDKVIVCVHGGGVRRWDGENFFYAVAKHYVNSVVMLVDQNQQNGDYITLNSLPIAINRIEKLLAKAKSDYPGVPIIVIGHSFGCGVASQLNLTDVAAMVLVTPVAGRSFQGYIKRYGKDAENGIKITTRDNLNKEYTAVFMSSIKGIFWKEEYTRIVKGPAPIYVFEAGSDEVIGDERYALRDVPFTKYTTLKGARHNLTGKYLENFFSILDPLLIL